MKKVDKKQEDWIQRKWRPMMAIMYMIVCIFDFIVFPIGFTIVQFWEIETSNDAFRQWQPLTLVGAGLFHMAMGAVLGITAWSRGQEKLQGVAGGSSMLPTTSMQSGSMMPTSYPMTPQASVALYKETTVDTITPIVSRGYGGKKAPPPAQEPEI